MLADGRLLSYTHGMGRYLLIVTALVAMIIFPRPVMATGSSCDELRVISGNNRFVPSTVSFHARATDPSGAQGYRFYFGDGSQADSTSADIQHSFTVSGTFTARVDIKDSQGTWKSGSTCQTIFSLLTSPLESQKSGCSNVFVIGTNYATAGTNVKFLVTGYDNKSGIKEYKIDFGNGQVKQSNTGTFDLTFSTPGTYTVKGYIKDSKDTEKGGAGSCQTPLYITGQPLQTQPSTGTPTWFTIVGLFSGLCLFLVSQKLYSHR